MIDKFMDIINEQLEKSWSKEEKQYATQWLQCMNCKEKVMLSNQTTWCAANDGGCLSCPECDKYNPRSHWEKEGVITTQKGIV